MAKQLHAVEFNGSTFGMELETQTEAYKRFRKSIKCEECITIFGDKTNVMTVPYMKLAAVMREAHWLVSERKCFNKIRIEGYGDEDIYVKYTEQMDFRDRFGRNNNG
ncbi:MAG: hypothetical protein IJ439_03690 [Tyzzerella sp.]|nr:hypothetical protein [Tyzzerella sp.]